MRQGQQHRRGRGRNNVSNNHNPGNRNKGQNPLTRSFESNGPDVKVRGTPAHIAEKYMQLARDAQSSGDHVLAENYLQHAEHYNRIILAYREQQMQQSGEMMNGNGRHPHQSRQEFGDGDDVGQEGSDFGDDTMQMDQPPVSRHMGEQHGRGEHGREMQPSFDEPRQHQPRNDQQPRFRDRHSRGDRPEQGERFDRRDRAFRGSADQPGEGREPRPQREPREPREFREPREPREPREFREPREPRESRNSQEPPREIAPPSPPIDNGINGEAPVAGRAEAPTPRRRERFGLGADQPEFLRRPVRRPRREPEQELAQEPAGTTPPAEEPSPE